jgi:hypothetical protein
MDSCAPEGWAIPEEIGQRDKHWYTKHYIENKKLSNTKPTKNRE